MNSVIVNRVAYILLQHATAYPQHYNMSILSEIEQYAWERTMQALYQHVDGIHTRSC